MVTIFGISSQGQFQSMGCSFATGPPFKTDNMGGLINIWLKHPSLYIKLSLNSKLTCFRSPMCISLKDRFSRNEKAGRFKSRSLTAGRPASQSEISPSPGGRVHSSFSCCARERLGEEGGIKTIRNLFSYYCNDEIYKHNKISTLQLEIYHQFIN